MIAVECANCDHRWVADFADAGKKLHCPACRAFVRVPAVQPAARVSHPALDAAAKAGATVAHLAPLLIVVALFVACGAVFLFAALNR